MIVIRTGGLPGLLVYKFTVSKPVKISLKTFFIFPVTLQTLKASYSQSLTLFPNKSDSCAIQ